MGVVVNFGTCNALLSTSYFTLPGEFPTSARNAEPSCCN